jgi:hypothetical protein
MEIINKHSCVVTNFVCREGNSLYKENSDNEFEYEQSEFMNDILIQKYGMEE